MKNEKPIAFKSKGNAPETYTRIISIIVAVVIVAAVGLFVWSVFGHKVRGDTQAHYETSPSPETSENPGTNPGTQPSADGSSFNILVLGFDRAAVLTDVMMIVNFNQKTGSVTIMQIPRDTYFENVNSEYYAKMNGVYRSYRANEGVALDVRAAQGMAQALEKSLCINIEKCVVMDLEGFKGMVDAVGGVDMYVPCRMIYRDSGQNLVIDLQEGYQHLNGSKAEQVVRYRSGFVRADISRENVQKLFMAAFLKKIKESISIDNADAIAALANNIVKYTTTDFTPNDIIDLAPKALSIDMENIKLITIPCNEFTERDDDGNIIASFIVINKKGTIKAINSYFNITGSQVTEDIFDKNELFVSSSAAMIEKYNSDTASIGEEGFSFNAGDIVDGTADVPIY